MSPSNVPAEVDPAVRQAVDRRVAAPRGSVADGLVSRIGGALNAHAVYGAPVERAGVTVIPVAKVAFGFGSGAGEGGPDTRGAGDGAGGGGTAVPLGFIEIRDDGAAFVPIRRPAKAIVIPLAFIAGATAVGIVSTVMKRRAIALRR
ncbi:spore germination protein GerW family protein [Nocardiopsis sediminis]|uniref:Spore germination protein GerW family protein n=1 Tax=Nocardiopsis sediminis TaxID=1778267 RepID=A0ABV8FVR9_9ACTN